MQQCIWTIFNEWAASCCCAFNMHHRAKSCTSLAEDTAEQITPTSVSSLWEMSSRAPRHSQVLYITFSCVMATLTNCSFSWCFICRSARSRLSPVMPSEGPQAAALMAAFPCMTFSEECSTHPHSLLHILLSDIFRNSLAAACFKTATMVSAVYCWVDSWFTKRDTRSSLSFYSFLCTVLVWLYPPAITSQMCPVESKAV